eukprot:140274_1
MKNKFYFYHGENCRYEKIGSQIIKHELNYLDKKKEHPLFVKAREFYLTHQWEKAKRQYEKLLSINPNNPTYHHSYACILSRFHGTNVRQITKLAQKHSDIASKLDPSDVYRRLLNVMFLIDLDQKDRIHEEFKIIFKQLLNKEIPKHTIKISLDIIDLHIALENYASYLFNLAEYDDAIKYLEKACAIQRKFPKQMGDIQQVTRHNLALYYLKTENIQMTKHYLAIMEQINQRTIWEKFQSIRQNDYEIYTNCKAEMFLLIGNYEEAYILFKPELIRMRQENSIYNSLLIVTQLIECCIELGKFEEVKSLDRQLFGMYRKNPSILKLARNANIGWEREFLVAYSLIKQGGLVNAKEAVAHMEYITTVVIKFNHKMGNRMPIAYFYLGLAYRNLCHYVNKHSQKTYYFEKAKFSLFQAANCIPMRAKCIFEFALILFEANELYLCKYYANKSWKCCKEIKKISEIYHKMKRRVNKQLKQIQCSYCGEHKYVKSKKQLDKLKVCTGCHRVYYCNKKCQKLHWNKLHRMKCSKIWIQWNTELFKTVENFNQFISYTQLTSDYALMFRGIDKMCA